jgi:sugar phosphate isomerase/epimerase
MIRNGFVTQLDMTLDAALDQAGKQEFDFVEIMMDGPGERTQLQPRTDELQELAADHDLDLLVHLPFKLDIGSPLDHVRDGAVKEVKAAIDTAVALGAEKGVLHASARAWSAAWTRDHIQDLLIASIQEINQYAVDQDFELCVENVPDEFFDIYDFPRLFEETDASMTLDTGHARISGMNSTDIAAFVDDFADRISHLHLNDTRRPQDEHLPFGAGNLDFEQILAPLKDDWTGTLSLEVFTDDWEYMQTSKDRLDELI